MSAPRPQVIAWKFLPTRLPFVQTLVFAMAMDHWQTPDVFRGAIWLLIVLLWIASLVGFFRQEYRQPVLEKLS